MMKRRIALAFATLFLALPAWALSGLNTNQVQIGSSATKIIDPRPRANGAVTIENLGTVDIWIGGSNVTTSTGHLLPGVRGAAMTVPGDAAIYGVVASGTANVSFMETY